MTVQIETIDFNGWQSTRLHNDMIELVIPQEIGIRIVRAGFIGGHNVFCEMEGQQGEKGDDTWRLYGGHRFWHAPEEKPRTYYPDNQPVRITEHSDFIRVTQPEESTTKLVKEIDIRMSPDSTIVELTHRLTNNGLWRIECAPWALSVTAPGTKGIVPLPPRGSHTSQLLPSNTLTLWAYTNMSDERWTWGEKYIMLQQKANMPPQKVGVDVRDGWAAAVRDGVLFVKRFDKIDGATYPDMGSVVEVFTNHFMLELETLGQMQMLAPGASLEHQETWYLFDDVDTPQTDADVDASILPKITETDV